MKKYVCMSYHGPHLTQPSAGGVASVLALVVRRFNFPWIFCVKKGQEVYLWASNVLKA